MFSLKSSGKNDPVPAAFVEAFGRLARRMKTDRLEARTMPDYWTALSDLPLDTVTAAAEVLAKEQVFFPAVAEWRQAAMRLRRPAPVTTCPHCANRGLIKLCYESGELFDLAICTCRVGQAYRVAGEGLVRQRFGLQDSQQVACIEDVEADA